MVTGAEVAIATAGQRVYLGAPCASEIMAYDAAGRLQLIVRITPSAATCGGSGG